MKVILYTSETTGLVAVNSVNPLPTTVSGEVDIGDSITRSKSSITIDGGTASAGTDVPINGRIEQIVVVAPSLDAGHTASLIIRDSDGYQLYSTGLTLSATSRLTPTQLVLSGTSSVVVSSSANETTDRDFVVVISYINQ